MNSIERITFLGLFDEFDVKAKSSNKFRVWDYNYQPCDILGVLLHRLNYPADGRGATDSRLKTVLNLPEYQIKNIYTEIDRTDSTNETIRELVKRCFDQHPIETASASY